MTASTAPAASITFHNNQQYDTVRAHAVDGEIQNQYYQRTNTWVSFSAYKNLKSLINQTINRNQFNTKAT